MLVAIVFVPETLLIGMQLLKNVKGLVVGNVLVEEVKMLVAIVFVPATPLTGMQLLKNVKGLVVGKVVFLLHGDQART
tara:strand:+ start:291 stop:524 length:234 start_codon:yes stop_codon:yes gene_type:complete